MQFIQRFALALVTLFSMLITTIPQPADADAFFSAGASAGVSFGIGVGINVDLAPPALPVYVQPPAPFVNAIWQPGYWAWGPDGYYWVPGTWIAAPRVGYLWTPGYWGFVGGYYCWHPGYWGTHIGFYGGINYGFGYFGHGFVGGGWYGGAFRYNTAVVNVNTTVIRNTYVDRTVVVNNYNTNITRVSYNGGDGVRAFPTAEERTYATEHHLGMTAEQRTHVQVAQQNRNYLASVNRGRPMDAAAAQPLSRENQPENFARINQADRATGMSMQSHATTNGQAGYHPEQLNRPQSQFRSFNQQPQQQYHPQNQTQYRPQNTYHPQQQRSFQQPQRQPQRQQPPRQQRTAAPHPHSTGRPPR
jgi:hypothetical protein